MSMPRIGPAPADDGATEAGIGCDEQAARNNAASSAAHFTNFNVVIPCAPGPRPAQYLPAVATNDYRFIGYYWPMVIEFCIHFDA